MINLTTRNVHSDKNSYPVNYGLRIDAFRKAWKYPMAFGLMSFGKPGSILWPSD